jgi:hypothetical protein
MKLFAALTMLITFAATAFYEANHYPAILTHITLAEPALHIVTHWSKPLVWLNALGTAGVVSILLSTTVWAFISASTAASTFESSVQTINVQMSVFTGSFTGIIVGLTGSLGGVRGITASFFFGAVILLLGLVGTQILEGKFQYPRSEEFRKTGLITTSLAALLTVVCGSTLTSTLTLGGLIGLSVLASWFALGLTVWGIGYAAIQLHQKLSQLIARLANRQHRAI